MANHKSMEIINSIWVLKAAGHSNRQISKTLGINRKTVNRHIENGPNPPLGSVPLQDYLAQTGPDPTPGSELDREIADVLRRLPCEGPPSTVLPHLPIVIEKLKEGMLGKSIYYDLVHEHGFKGSYESVKRLLRHVRATPPEWIPRLEHPLGEAAQVDFGEARVLQGKGKHRRKAYLFVMTLCGSRKAYVEAVADQSQETFIACHMRAFSFFGGVPLTVVPDNLKSAVIQACWENPVLNRLYRDLSRHYGFAILPCRVRSPQEKGVVESGVKYVKGHLKGRCFASLDELNAWLAEWEQKVAGTRIHGTTKRQVNEAFEEELKHLQPLPSEPFDIFRVESRVVHPDGFIQVGARYYEVPPAYLGRQVIVHVHASVLRVFDGEQQIVMHARGAGKGARVRGMWEPPREVPRAQSELEAWVRRDAGRVGPSMQAYVDTAITAKGRIAYRMLQGVLALRDKYSPDVMEAVAGELTAAHIFDGKLFRQRCLEHSGDQAVELLQEHAILRDLSEYCVDRLNDSPATKWSSTWVSKQS